MKKSGKNIEKARKAVESRPYTLQEAVPLLQKVKFARFDETVEVTLRLGVDPKHADQMVRGTVVLPHGLGKSKKVLVIASGEKVREGEAAGADVRAGKISLMPDNLSDNATTLISSVIKAKPSVAKGK